MKIREAVRKLDKCKVQLTEQKEILKNQERDLRVVKKIKRRWSRMGKTNLLQNKRKDRKRRIMKKNRKSKKKSQELILTFVFFCNHLIITSFFFIQ